VENIIVRKRTPLMDICDILRRGWPAQVSELIGVTQPVEPRIREQRTDKLYRFFAGEIIVYGSR